MGMEGDEAVRIYTDPVEAVKEVERDLWEMGIDVHPQTMQDKDVANDADYMTKEVRGYGFQIVGYTWTPVEECAVLEHILPKEQWKAVGEYMQLEFQDRVCNVAQNPGNSWKAREQVWNEFMHDGKFAYTYSERMTPQLMRILAELREHPDTRQAIINIHSNIRSCCEDSASVSPARICPDADLMNMGGHARIPCSMYYQLMIREGKLDLIYTMRSCDFLVHFPVDIMLALRIQEWAARQLEVQTGMFTYFTGSLHAYAKDMKVRGIF